MSDVAAIVLLLAGLAAGAPGATPPGEPNAVAGAPTEAEAVRMREIDTNRALLKALEQRRTQIDGSSARDKAASEFLDRRIAQVRDRLQAIEGAPSDRR